MIYYKQCASGYVLISLFYYFIFIFSCRSPVLIRNSPLVYQTTTSSGLAQVQLCSPKVVVVTGAAARTLKNGITFLPKIKSSPPIKYEYVRPLSHCLRVQSIKFGIVQVDVRTSTYQHLHLLR